MQDSCKNTRQADDKHKMQQNLSIIQGAELLHCAYKKPLQCSSCTDRNRGCRKWRKVRPYLMSLLSTIHPAKRLGLDPGHVILVFPDSRWSVHEAVSVIVSIVIQCDPFPAKQGRDIPFIILKLTLNLRQRTSARWQLVLTLLQHLDCLESDS